MEEYHGIIKNKLFTLWQEKSGAEKVQNHLISEVFPGLSDPFVCCLRVVSPSGRKNKKKHTNWSKIHPPKAKSFNSVVIQSFAKWFLSLDEKKRNGLFHESIKSQITTALNHMNFTGMAYLISSLKVQSFFPLKSCAIPLALKQDGYYLDLCICGKQPPQTRVKLVSELDSLLALSEDELEKFCKKDCGVYHMGQPQVAKLVSKYRQRFSVPMSEVPNLVKLEAAPKPKATSTSTEVSQPKTPSTASAPTEDVYIKWLSVLDVLNRDIVAAPPKTKHPYYLKFSSFVQSNILEKVENPFETGLKLSELAIQRKNYQLASLILDGLKRHEQTRVKLLGKDEFLKRFITDSVKKRAMTLFLRRDLSTKYNFLGSKIADVLLLKETLPGQIASKNYYNAAFLISYCGNHDQFNIEDVLVPCFLQKSHRAVHMYLVTKGQIQNELINYVNKLIAMPHQERVTFLTNRIGSIPPADFESLDENILQDLSEKMLRKKKKIAKRPLPGAVAKPVISQGPKKIKRAGRGRGKGGKNSSNVHIPESEIQSTSSHVVIFSNEPNPKPVTKPKKAAGPWSPIVALAPLSPGLRNCLRVLEWSMRTGKSFEEFIFNIYDNSINPMAVSLQLMENSSDFYKSQGKKQKRLSSVILFELKEWIKRKKFEAGRFLTEVLQLRAFGLVTVASNTLYLPLIVDLFQLNTIKPRMILNLKPLIEAKLCRLATQTISLLDLQDSFSHPYLLIACCLQDGDTLVKQFLTNRQDLQLNFVNALDGLLYNQEQKTHYGSLFGWKRLTKLSKIVKKFASTYSIPINLTPNLMRQQSEGALNYFVQQRFNLGKQRKKPRTEVMSDQSWFDCVQMMIEQCPSLVFTLLRHLAGLRRIEEAARWINILGIRMNSRDIPPGLKDFLIKHPNYMQRAVKIGTELKVPLVARGCARLPDAIFDNVRIVNNRSLFDQFSTLLDTQINNETSVLVALDSEWQPSFIWTGEGSQKTAILQVAWRDHIDLLDIFSLQLILSEDEWIDLFERLLCNDNGIRRIAFEFSSGDMISLCSRLPICTKIKGKTKVLCLNKLVKKLRNINSKIMSDFLVETQNGAGAANESQDDILVLNSDSESDSEVDKTKENDELPKEPPKPQKPNFSLADLYQYCTGKTLDKSEQLTNWEKRPLRPSQIHYAAMDAYCQIEIYDCLKRKANGLSIDFEKAVDELLGKKTVKT